MPITINSNIASLSTQRRLTEVTADLRKSFGRLSSGLRINQASDDAAGLSISSSLKVDARVYGQGLRNINDGTSMLDIAEGSLKELQNISIRQRELAEQAANGTYSSAQRGAMDKEANALVKEFNRIINSTKFNGQTLLDRSIGTLKIQGGYGVNGGISFALGDQLARSVSSGTFQDATALALGSDMNASQLGDLNGDGLLDIIAANYYDGSVEVALGNGDGSFRASVSYNVAGNFHATKVAIGDYNGDGRMDIIEAGYNSIGTVGSRGAFARVFLATAGGSYTPTVSVRLANSSGSNSVGGLVVGDLNADGFQDFITLTNNGSHEIDIFFGSASGSLAASVSIATPGLAATALTLGDIDNDGDLDIGLGADNFYTRPAFSILRNSGSGTFTTVVSDVHTVEFNHISVASVRFGDLNGDGKLDLISTFDTDDDPFAVQLGNGDGTFQEEISGGILSGIARDSRIGDINGDGLDDVIFAGYANGGDLSAQIFFGSRNGSFSTSVSYATGTYLNSAGMGVGDINGDGATDLIIGNYNSDHVSILIGDSTKSTFIANLDLTTRFSALTSMNVLDSQIRRISAELGAIGSTQSRLGVALSNIGVARDNFTESASRITDADVAEEAATLSKRTILQQAASAVLAQANQQPAIALALLR